MPSASGAYAMTKYVLEALTDALRFEIHGFGVRVVLLEPGEVRTQFTPTLTTTVPRTDESGPYATLMKSVLALAEREGTRGLAPEDVAKVVLKAIRSRRPRTRYVVGSQARVATLTRRLLSDRPWDRALARACRVQ
jgi:NAD(P)-dependent dehydrogenase (short-subunit alcohol dehydrogenase family)